MRHKENGSCSKSTSTCDEDPIKNTVSLIKQKVFIHLFIYYNLMAIKSKSKGIHKQAEK